MHRPILLLLLSFVLRSDTITLRDNSVFNGDVSFKEGKFTVAGRWPKEERRLFFAASEVKTIRFNKNTMNQDPLTNELVARAMKTEKKGLTEPDCEATHGTKRIQGKLRGIDEENVWIDSKAIRRSEILIMQIGK